MRLAQQIASRSDDFFRTMSSHDKLQDDVMRTCADIQHLRYYHEDCFRCKNTQMATKYGKICRFLSGFLSIFTILVACHMISFTQRQIIFIVISRWEDVDGEKMSRFKWSHSIWLIFAHLLKCSLYFIIFRIQMKNIEDILVRRTFNVIRLYRLRSRYIVVQEKVNALWFIASQFIPLFIHGC